VNFLTLDLASRVGWSCGPIPTRLFDFGSHQLPKTGTDIGAFIFEYDAWLQTMLDDVYYIVFEQPIMPAITQIATLRKLYGLASHTEFVATTRGIKCREAPVQKVKSFMGVKRTGDQGKRDMVDAVARYGYEAEDHDAADAIGIRLFTISVERPELLRSMRLDLGPLGARAAG
jgi:hypothetical protein